MQNEYVPRAFKIYNIYFVLWKLSHIYPYKVDTSYFKLKQVILVQLKLKGKSEDTSGLER